MRSAVLASLLLLSAAVSAQQPQQPSGTVTGTVIAQDTRFKCAVSGASISNILAGYGTDEYVRDYETELGQPWKNTQGWMKISFQYCAPSGR